MHNFIQKPRILLILTFAILAFIFSVVSYFPATPITHWTFRVFDYIRIQILVLQILLVIVSFFLFDKYPSILLVSQIFLTGTIIYQATIIFPYLPTFNLFKNPKNPSNVLTVISVNVLQKNSQYNRLIELINEVQPDILLTLETNKEWENALQAIEKHYSYTHKIPLENRYGLHFYTKLEVKKSKEHYFITDDRPAIEAHLFDYEGNDFVFLGIHPPPPSPTEKPTSKQKDAEFMKAAQLIRKLHSPSLVTGDFNNVCWSRSARMFAKVSNLQDSRIGKGIHGTFPVRPSFMRFPLDLLFSSKEIQVHEIKTLRDVGSDHLPFFAKFSVVKSNYSKPTSLNSELKEHANDIIEEGEKAAEEEE